MCLSSPLPPANRANPGSASSILCGGRSAGRAWGAPPVRLGDVSHAWSVGYSGSAAPQSDERINARRRGRGWPPPSHRPSEPDICPHHVLLVEHKGGVLGFMAILSFPRSVEHDGSAASCNFVSFCGVALAGAKWGWSTLRIATVPPHPFRPFPGWLAHKLHGR